MSVESGIAPFRGENGLWQEFDAQKYAHIESYRQDPERSWELFRLQIEEIYDAEPHQGHEALVKMEEEGLTEVITQNIDGLHQKAGSSQVLELHGTLFTLFCPDCEREYNTSEFIEEVRENRCPRCECGTILRPDAVLFGEQLPQDTVNRSLKAAEGCDLMMVVGTSAVVQPAASLPVQAKRTGATVVEINLESTPLTSDVTDLFIKGKAREVLKNIAEKLYHQLFSSQISS